MIPANTSVWVEHLRVGSPALAEALEEGLVINHPFVAGELACGNLANRAEVLSLLQSLAQAPLVPDAKALVFIESRALMGRGIGYIHVHLLASAALHADAKL